MCWWTPKPNIHSAVRDMNVGRVKRHATILSLLMRCFTGQKVLLCLVCCSVKNDYEFLESAMESQLVPRPKGLTFASPTPLLSRRLAAVCGSKNNAAGWDGVPVKGWNAVTLFSASLVWENVHWPLRCMWFLSLWNSGACVFDQFTKGKLRRQ